MARHHRGIRCNLLLVALLAFLALSAAPRVHAEDDDDAPEESPDAKMEGVLDLSENQASLWGGWDRMDNPTFRETIRVQNSVLAG